MRFTVSVWERKTFAFVSPSVSVTPSLAMPTERLAVLDLLPEPRAECPLCSMSKMRTWSVADTIVRSFEYGINLTEKMLLRWPVIMDVVRLNCDVDDSGWYEWMLMRWSSEPEASSRPDVDQL
jgi:hypothetical protein